jgi:hypothetical protein
MEELRMIGCGTNMLHFIEKSAHINPGDAV